MRYGRWGEGLKMAACTHSRIDSTEAIGAMGGPFSWERGAPMSTSYDCALTSLGVGVAADDGDPASF